MGRSPCCSKEAGLNRGSWTAHEDKILTEHIKIHGEGRWRNLPQKAGLRRCGKSCRLRWLNYLRPDIKRGNISPDEEDLIIRLHKLLGNRWSLIAGRLPGRTDNEIKNYWNTNLSKKVNPNIRTTITRPSGDVAPRKTKNTVEAPNPLSPARVVRARAVKCTKVVLNADTPLGPNPSSATSDPQLNISPCDNPRSGSDRGDVDELFLADLLASDGYFGDTNYDLGMPSYDRDHHHDLLFSEELTVHDHWGNIVNCGDDVGPTSFSTSFLCGEGDWLAAD